MYIISLRVSSSNNMNRNLQIQYLSFEGRIIITHKYDFLYGRLEY